MISGPSFHWHAQKSPALFQRILDEENIFCLNDTTFVGVVLHVFIQGVNVQPCSCTSANFAMYTWLLLRDDRIMRLGTPFGGNTSQECYLSNCRLTLRLGVWTMTSLRRRSSYPREWDYKRSRQITDKYGMVLLCDMDQISGLVALKEC
ncbi:serine hydroxymethyltransferase, partial [Striga asiatica]